MDLDQILDRFQIIYTSDQSPSLKPLQAGSESMHNLNGAFSESLYLYEEAIRLSFKNLNEVHCASVGLGLGYNELLFCSLSLKSNKTSRIHSFESCKLLSQSFLSWIFDKATPLKEIYEKIVFKYEDHFQIKALDLKKHLRLKFNNKEWKISGNWEKYNTKNGQFNCLLLDLYSQKINPELWDELFLEEVFLNYLGLQSCVSTYASTGSLNRALKKTGFRQISKKGFGGKRNSTLATRGFEYG